MYRSAWQLRADGEVIRGIRGNQRSSEVIEGHMCGSREPMVSPRTLHTRSVPMYIVLAKPETYGGGFRRAAAASWPMFFVGVLVCSPVRAKVRDAQTAKKLRKKTPAAVYEKESQITTETLP